MALKITKANEVIEVKQLITTIYAQPGLGKTSLAFTADRPLLLDFDGGAYRAADRGDAVLVEKWADVAGIRPDDLADYDTIVIDTVGKALEFLAADVISQNSKHGWGGALNQQGWGQLGIRFRAFLSSLTKHGKDIILVSHMDEKHDGDQLKERLQIQGGSKNLVHTESDMMARIVIHDRTRQLAFSPTEATLGKDPAGFEVKRIPDAKSADFPGFMGRVIADAKSALNKLSEEQLAQKGEVEWFAQHLPDVKDADAINDLLGRAKLAGREVSKMVMERADALGLEFDPETRGYVYLEQMDMTPKDQDISEEGAA